MAFAAGSFCFFMPLRYGAALLATLQFLLSAILAIALWIEVAKWSLDVGVRLTGTSAAAATYYTILSCSALIGSVAIFTRNKGILRYFAFCLGWSLGIQLAISALQLWGYLSTPTPQLLAACVQVPGMNESKCNTAFALSVGWLIASIVVGLLIQLCSAYVVSSYSSKLSSEDDVTEKAPAPRRFSISAPQLNGQPAVAPTFVSLDLSGGNLTLDEKKWAASPRDSLDGSDDDEPRLDPGPPKPPMLDPAPAKRIPRVSPKYPDGMGPGSTDAAVIAASTNPFTDNATPEGGLTDGKPQSLNPFSDAVNVDAAKMV